MFFSHGGREQTEVATWRDYFISREAWKLVDPGGEWSSGLDSSIVHTAPVLGELKTAV